MSRTVTLSPASLDTITTGGTVAVAAEPGLTFEVTSEDGWTASSDPDVIRFALSPHDLKLLRWGRTVTVLPVGFDGSVQFTVDAAVVAR